MPSPAPGLSLVPVPAKQLGEEEGGRSDRGGQDQKDRKTTEEPSKQTQKKGKKHGDYHDYDTCLAAGPVGGLPLVRSQRGIVDGAASYMDTVKV